MDKKNTLLLTVIAVATLLVAVVGATFAYFSVTATNTDTSSAITATTEAVGTVALSTNNPTLGIITNAADFSQSAAGTGNYHSVANPTASNKYTTSANLLPIFTATSSNSNGATYRCTATVSIVVDGTMASQLASGDAELVLSGAATGTYDLAASSLQTTPLPTSIVFDNVVDLTPVALNAEVILHNTSSIQNVGDNNISGKTLTVTFTSSAFSCVTK
jgi:hypothetical protein